MSRRRNRPVKASIIGGEQDAVLVSARRAHAGNDRDPAIEKRHKPNDKSIASLCTSFSLNFLSNRIGNSRHRKFPSSLASTASLSLIYFDKTVMCVVYLNSPQV